MNASVQASDGRTWTTTVDTNIASSKLQYNSIQGCDYVIVAVDTSMTQGMSLATIGDYAAMVGLMELQPKASGDFDAHITRGGPIPLQALD